MHAERHVVVATTNGSGVAEVYTPAVTGRVLGIRYAKTDFANGVDFVVTAEATGEAILTATDCNASASFYPLVPADDELGADATLDGTRKMRVPVTVANDRIKIAVAQGGDTKTGTFHVIIG